MDVKLNYVEAGAGFPLVLLHGNGEDHTYFKRQMEPFSARYRVIAVDTRGHGDSPRGSAPFTLEQFAGDLKEFLDQIGIASCHLLGFSDGGNIALLFALKYARYLKKLVLNGADLHPSGVKLSTQVPIVLHWCASGLAMLGGGSAARWEMLNLMVTQPHISRRALKGLEVPTLVIAGDRDMIRESHTRAIAAALPDSRLAILPGDHFVARRNWAAFNAAVLEFLEG